MTRARQALAALIGAALLVTVYTAVATAGSAATPGLTDLRLVVNGKRQPVEKLNSKADKYVPIDTGRLRIVARWSTNLRGSGYRVVIGSVEPTTTTYATCSTGTSCVVKRYVSIGAGYEMALTAKVVKAGTNRVVGGFRVCLLGKG